MDDRWAVTFSPGWYYQPGLKGPLVPGAKNAEANAKLGYRSKVYSLVVMRSLTRAKVGQSISYYQSRELWLPATASTSPKILSAVRSRVVRLRCLEADFIVSGFPLLLLAFPSFSSDSARLL